MTKTQFQKQFSEHIARFLETPEGKAFFVALSFLKPAYSKAHEIHLFAEESGARRGYETCLVEMLSLAQPPKPQVQDVPATYGVPDLKDKPAKK